MKKFYFFILLFVFNINFVFAYNCDKYSDGSNRAIGDVDGNKIIDKEDNRIIFEFFLSDDYLVCADINQNGKLDEEDIKLIGSKLDIANDRTITLNSQPNSSYPFGEISSANITVYTGSSSSSINIIISSPKDKEIYSMNNVLLTVRDTNSKAKIWKYSLNGEEKIQFDSSKNIFLTAPNGENNLSIFAYISENSGETSKKISFFVKSSGTIVNSQSNSNNQTSIITEEQIVNNIVNSFRIYIVFFR